MLFGDLIGCDIEEGGEWKLLENADDDGDANETSCVSPWLEDVFLGGDLCNERGIVCDTEGDVLASLLDAGGVSWLEDTYKHTTLYFV